jgi:Asp-tRNA(Asn)/Glu-tRNA(Gln) amidotransferase A subunit family amidase
VSEDSEIYRLSLAQLTQGLDTKTFSASELAEYFLARVQSSSLNAFIDVQP